MVMAARAANGESEERGRGHPENVIELVIAIDVRIGGLVVPATQTQERRGDLGLRIGAFDLVAGKVFGQEAVERLVVVERVDDVVAVAPGVRLRPVSFVAIRLRVADDVEPVSRPLLPASEASRSNPGRHGAVSYGGPRAGTAGCPASRARAK